MNIEEEVEKGIELLKQICDSPSKYITNYIKEIKDRVNYEFERVKQDDDSLASNPDKLEQLKRLHDEFTNRIGEFEYECWFSNKLEKNLIKQTLEKLESIESIFKMNPYENLEELYELIEIELQITLSNIFHNKTLVFIHNFTNNEDRNVFLGNFKLLIVTNEFIGLNLVDILIKNQIRINEIESIRANFLKEKLLMKNLSILEQEINLKNITELILSGKKIKRISVNGLNGLVNLKKLNLNLNEIRSLNEFTFKGLSSLELLTLYGNRITAIKANVFGDLINLKKLNLSSNKINFIDALGFRGLKSLEVLHLNINELEELKENHFGGLVKLKQLWLSGNKIETIHADSFSELVNLEELIIVDNLMPILTDKHFQNLKKLKKLFTDIEEFNI